MANNTTEATSSADNVEQKETHIRLDGDEQVTERFVSRWSHVPAVTAAGATQTVGTSEKRFENGLLASNAFI